MKASTRFVVTRLLLDVQFWFPIWFLYLQRRGYRGTDIGLADGLFYLFSVISEVPVARFSDRIGRKLSLVLASTGSAGVFALMAILDGSVPLLMVAWSLWGIIWSLNSGLVTAYAWELAQSTSNAESPRTLIAKVRVAGHLAVLSSVFAAGWLFERQPSIPFWITAALALVSIPLVLSLPDTTRHHVTPPGNVGYASIRELARRLRKPILATTLASLLVLPVLGLLQPLAWYAGLSPSGIAIVYCAFAFARMAGAALASRRHYKGVSSLGWSLMICGVLLLVVYAVHTTGMSATALLVVALIGFVAEACLIWCVTEIADGATHMTRATAISLSSLTSGAALMLLRPALTWIGYRQGTAIPFAVWGLACMAAGVVWWIYRLRSRNRVGS